MNKNELADKLGVGLFQVDDPEWTVDVKKLIRIVDGAISPLTDIERAIEVPNVKRVKLYRGRANK